MIRAAEAFIQRVNRPRPADATFDDGPHNLVPPAHRRPAVAALLLFAMLSVVHTWPLASGLQSLSRHDNADAVLNEWAVAWIAHQMPRDPWHLFDANIFYPEQDTLAFSEHMFVQGMMGAPLLWMGVPTLVVHNLLVLAGFTLTGWTMCLVLRRRTGSWLCGTLAGMLLAFNSHSLSRIAHLQAVHVEFLPLAMYAFDRLLTRPGVANALRLSAMYALQGLTSNYLLAFMTFGLTGAGLARANEWLARSKWRVLGLVCLSGLAAVLLLSPFLIHYLQAQQNQGLTRSLQEVAKYTASWRDYLSSPANIHYSTWSQQFWRSSGAPLFPGVTAICLASIAIGTGIVWRHRAARMWLALGIVGLVLSFGAALPGYAFLYHAVPLLQGIRASVRFGYLALAGVAALAAFGLVVVRGKFANRPLARRAITTAALGLVFLEALRIPVGYTRPHVTPVMYTVLGQTPGVVLVELPIPEPGLFHENAHYMLHATAHWRPLVNGYSGFLPASYVTHYQRLQSFPDDASIAYLREIGVTHVAVHARGFAATAGQAKLDAIARQRSLQATMNAQNLTFYEVRRDPR